MKATCHIFNMSLLLFVSGCITVFFFFLSKATFIKAIVLIELKPNPGLI